MCVLTPVLMERSYHTRDVSWVDDQGIFHRDLTLPPAADEETVVGAPPYIIGGWAGVAGDRLTQGVTGLWNNKVRAVSVIPHPLGI